MIGWKELTAARTGGGSVVRTANLGVLKIISITGFPPRSSGSFGPPWKLIFVILCKIGGCVHLLGFHKLGPFDPAQDKLVLGSFFGALQGQIFS